MLLFVRIKTPSGATGERLFQIAFRAQHARITARPKTDDKHTDGKAQSTQLKYYDLEELKHCLINIPRGLVGRVWTDARAHLSRLLSA